MRDAVIAGIAAAVMCGAGAWPCGSTAPSAHAAESPVIRVGILVDRPSVDIGADGPVTVEDVSLSMYAAPVPAALPPRAAAAAWIATASATGGLDLSGVALGPAVRITARRGLLRADGRPYRGVLELRRTVAAHVTVVNVVDLESYLYGVIKGEMEPSWPREAVRAQAVAARTLAVERMLAAHPPVPGLAGAGAGFDVPATTDAQVYLGAAAEDPAATAAVDATRGLVAAYDGRPIFAAYHANSGGHTDDSENVWGRPYPYLRGVPDPYALEAPGVSWSAVVPLGTIETDLRRGGIDLAGLVDLAAGRVTTWGRVLTVIVREESGRTQEINANRFRLLVGPAVLRSTMLSLARRDREVAFAGRGSGHGVGLDQWGARAMAARGFTYEQILKYYYTGVMIEPRY
ncbi:MAG TPA: SpoIID/LytB domain-containing protein [bacterium]|nr:SpoIID/LytB domain-containing protein [bacterium]